MEKILMVIDQMAKVQQVQLKSTIKMYKLENDVISV